MAVGELRSFQSSTTRPPCLGPGQVNGSRARQRSVWPFRGRPFSCMQPIVNLSDSGARMPLGVWEAVGCSFRGAGSLIWVWDGTAKSVPLLLISRTNARTKSPRRQARPKPGLWGCVGADPALVPDAASLLVEWAHQQNLSGVPKRVRVESVLRWRLWVTPGCERASESDICMRQRTCLFASDIPVQSRGVWDCWMGTQW